MGNFRLVKNLRNNTFESYVIEVPVSMLGSPDGRGHRLLYVTPEVGLSSDMDDAKPFTTALEAIAYAVTIARLDAYHEDVVVEAGHKIEVVVDYTAKRVSANSAGRSVSLTFPAFEALRKVPFKIKEEAQ